MRIKIPVTTGFVLLMIIAAACPGCSTQLTSVKAGEFGEASSGGTGADMPSGSAGSGSFPPAGTVVNASQVFREDFSWVRYRHTESYNGKITVSDYITEGGAAVYGGQPAYHAKTTITSADGSVRIQDFYWDTAKKNLLGGTLTVTSGGQTTTTKVHSSTVSTGGTEFESGIPLVFAGAGPVTVPNGTFAAAGKYTRVFTPPGSSGTITETSWAVPGISPPVKNIRYSGTDETTYSMDELVAWGNGPV